MNPTDYLDTARKLADAMLDLVPPEVAKQFLTDAAVRRANIVADTAEAIKFLGFGGPENDEGSKP